jgi:glycosyltransferase involved in cell wall biosynthesis
MESIVAGVPTIATDVGSIRDIFGQHGVGTLTVPDVEGISIAIDRSLSTIESLSREAWIAGHDAAQSYSHAQMARMYEECIRKIARAGWLK